MKKQRLRKKDRCKDFVKMKKKKTEVKEKHRRFRKKHRLMEKS